MKKLFLNITEEIAEKLELTGLTWTEKDILVIRLWKIKITISKILNKKKE